MTEPPKAPNLHEWIERHGGYDKVPWADWDAAMAEWAGQMRLFQMNLHNVLKQGEPHD